jgi:hypothetical protein
VQENEGSEVPARKKRRSREQIAELVREFTASGLTQRKFCEDRGIALSELQRSLKIVRSDSDFTSSLVSAISSALKWASACRATASTSTFSLCA